MLLVSRIKGFFKPKLHRVLDQFNRAVNKLEVFVKHEEEMIAKRVAEIRKHNVAKEASEQAIAKAKTVQQNLNNLLGN